jgi:hypothetical protein
LAVGVGVDEQSAVLALPLRVGEQHGTGSTQGVQIVWIDRDKPARLTGPRIASEQAGGPFVVAGPWIGVPRCRMTGSVQQGSAIAVIGEIAGQSTAALLPSLRRPRRNTAISALITLICRREIGTDADVGIRTS